MLLILHFFDLSDWISPEVIYERPYKVTAMRRQQVASYFTVKSTGMFTVYVVLMSTHSLYIGSSHGK